MRTLSVFFSFILLANATFSQKKQLTIDDMVTWKQIQSSRISANGNWVSYILKAEEGDGTLYLWDAVLGKTYSFSRGENASFTDDSQFLVFRITPFSDTLKAQRRRKVKRDDLPKDTIAVLNLKTQSLTRYSDVKTFSVPEKWSGWLMLHKEIEKPDTTKNNAKTAKAESNEPDTTQVATAKTDKKKPKKESKDTGTKLAFLNLSTGEEIIVPFVKDYRLATEGQKVVFHTSGDNDSLAEGVYLFDCEAKDYKPLYRGKGEFKQFSFDEKGTQLSFLANFDSIKSQVPSFRLLFWKDGKDSATVIADNNSYFLPKSWLISDNARPAFSKDGKMLYFGIAPTPILQDTNLLEEEIVNVEVWNWTDGRLHTNQKTLIDREKRRTYDVIWHIDDNRFVPIASRDMPDVSYDTERNAKIALGSTEEPYLQLLSWEGASYRDVWLVDLNTGAKKEIARKLRGSGRLSPQANYAAWYNELDSAWFSYSVASGEIIQITNNKKNPFYNELNDVPDFPNSYNFAGWTKDDKHILIYDRYDIWQVDPTGKADPVNLTNGRAQQTVYRYVQLDSEERFIDPNSRLLLFVFDEKTKASGYAYLTIGSKPVNVLFGNFEYALRPQKAKKAERVVFSKEDFRTFPDLLYADLSFSNPKKISNANPQQASYSWGSAELYSWTSLDGIPLQGILVKPEGFDPKKKYPMIVNFYERSSDGLHNHATPVPGRSSINYAYYASRGYVIFNPDIPYRDGYPGESCYNAVIPGVTSLIDKGFIDKDRIGVQGHSWGGYQIAYLITKTNIFRCAESGAPVVNMPSAYGGIRWETGLVRQFQYEHSQSRIGGTIWEYPLRYIENSPLFFLDKVQTPVLIMANDADGHVPWYQGIEFFTAMRRLGKPAWMLNYNNQPHWPVLLQNRKDFQLRMSQFFDYYLKDAPMPQWMKRGVPAIEKGILQGLEPAGDRK